MPVDGLYHISIGCLSILSVLFGLLCPTCFAVADLFQSKCQLRSHSPPAPSTSITNSLRIGKSTEIIGKLTKIIGHGHSYGTLPEGSININNNMNMKGITQRKLPCWWHFHFARIWESSSNTWATLQPQGQPRSQGRVLEVKWCRNPQKRLPLTSQKGTNLNNGPQMKTFTLW